MTFPALNDPYSLLALFLTPWKDAKTIDALAQSMPGESCDWGRLLHMANLHLCSPLWFVRLGKDRLLHRLPTDLQDYLLLLHQQNAERNAMIRAELRGILSEFRIHGVPAILLKGAATFIDDLYEDPGARMMADVDLLVKPQHLTVVKDVLGQLGYRQQPDSFNHSIGFPDAYLPHHLPPFAKKEKGLAVEVHFEAARGQAGRVLPAKSCWENHESVSWQGVDASFLSPTHRLLHNAAHALVPRQRSVNSFIHLAQLAEFSYISQRYSSTIDWAHWMDMGTREGLGREFRTYLTLATRLLRMPLPSKVSQVAGAVLHTARISGMANVTANNLLSAGAAVPENVIERLRVFATVIFVRVYRHLKMPAWEWRNRFYREGLSHIPIRLLYLSLFLSRFYWARAIDFRRSSHKMWN